MNKCKKISSIHIKHSIEFEQQQKKEEHILNELNDEIWFDSFNLQQQQKII